MAREPNAGRELAVEIARLEAEISDLRKRWPAHSVKPAMVRQLEELEERLSLLKKKSVRAARYEGADER